MREKIHKFKHSISFGARAQQQFVPGLFFITPIRRKKQFLKQPAFR